jgi:predicted nuclease of predicted toxin-antitoxin system
MEILIDMNLSPTWVDYFSKNDISSIHWSSIGKALDLDTEIFKFAQKSNLIIFTNDLDFGAILAATNANFPSVFQLKSQELMPEFIGNLVVEKLNEYKTLLKEGALVTFDTIKTRARILPLR